MPMIPQIAKQDITINEKLRMGFANKDCIEGLWSICNLIGRIARLKGDKPETPKILSYLYCIGYFGCFENDDFTVLSVDAGKKDVKAGAFFPKPTYLFELEEFGFKIFDLELADEDKPRNKLTIKDVLRFRISFKGDEYALLGLKLFAEACGKITGDPFDVGDIRVMFEGASRLYAPPVDEIFYVLEDAQKKIFLPVHERLTELGCERNLERAYMMRYVHPKSKGKTFATMYLVYQPWFSVSGEKVEYQIKLNLRNIAAYTDYLKQCTRSIQKAVKYTADCGGCKKACGGVSFEFDGKYYVKCPTHIFRFSDFSDRALENYLALINLENERLMS